MTVNVAAAIPIAAALAATGGAGSRGTSAAAQTGTAQGASTGQPPGFGANEARSRDLTAVLGSTLAPAVRR